MSRNLKPKTLLVGLAVFLAACSSDAPQTATVAVSNQLSATPTPLPTRAVVASTSVSADGELALAVPTVKLGFELNGKVETVNVTTGQAVKKGDVLATIDDTSLQDAVTDADLALKLVEANIQVQNAPATKADLAAAQASLNAASASYNATKAGTSQTEIDNAARSVEAAWKQYLAAQMSRDAACGTAQGLDAPDCKSQEANYGNAFESWVAARDSYQQLLEPVSKNTLTQAYASVASAKAKLDSLKADVSAEQQAIDAAQVEQAKAALERAQSNLSKTKLVSPCDCIVQEANVAVGAVPTGTAFTLVDLSAVQFKTTNLTERDVSKIQVGAPASIRLKPYAVMFTGTVSAVLSQSSGTQSGAALYTALIDLDPTDKQLLPGMTGQAEITMR